MCMCIILIFLLLLLWLWLWLLLLLLYYSTIHNIACITILSPPYSYLSLGVSHCASSDACVLAIEGYHDFIGNCIGRGNRRIFALFLLLAGLTCALFTVLSWTAHMQGLCPHLASNKGATRLLILGCSVSLFLISHPSVCLSIHVMSPSNQPQRCNHTYFTLPVSSHFLSAP